MSGDTLTGFIATTQAAPCSIAGSIRGVVSLNPPFESAAAELRDPGKSSAR
jgi:hypothetical protein